jgi:ABC-type xylose transport system permease subunit
MKLQKALSLLQLLIGETIGLFIAGIAVPSFLRSGTATNHALAAHSLHILTIAPVTFSYTFQDVGFAILGALCGAVMALAIDSPATVGNAARIFRMLRENSRRIYLSNRKLA